jgi:putative flippase GtrA
MALRTVIQEVKVEATKFTLVGAANSVLTFVVFTVLLKAFSLHYLLALFVAWLVGMTFSYALNSAWVFRTGGKFAPGTRYFKFLLAGAVSLGLNLLVLRFLVERTGWDPFYVQLGLVPFIVGFNFSTAKYWSLRAAP